MTVPSSGMSPAGPEAPDEGAVPSPVVGRRKTNVPPETTSPAPSGSAGGMVAVPSVLVDRPSGVTGADGGVLGSAPCGEPQETRRSWSPPNPDWWARSAPHAEAGSGRPPYGSAGCGSSSKKCGPVSSTETGGEPAGDVSDRPSEGAGRLVPGTQEAPFQYRTYPGMDGSG